MSILLLQLEKGYFKMGEKNSKENKNKNVSVESESNQNAPLSQNDPPGNQIINSNQNTNGTIQTLQPANNTLNYHTSQVLHQPPQQPIKNFILFNIKIEKNVKKSESGPPTSCYKFLPRFLMK